MARSLNGADMVAGGLLGALGDNAYQPDKFRIRAPDSGGNDAPRINDMFAELEETYGGGAVTLEGAQPYVVNSSLNARASNLMIRGTGTKNACIIQKGNSFPNGDTLLSFRGGTGSARGEAQIAGCSMENVRLSGRAPNNALKDGWLLDTSYTSAMSVSHVIMGRCPSTAWYREKEWDSITTDARLVSCGGPLGASDAAMRIKSPPDTDSSNIMRHYGLWFESFKNSAWSIEPNDAGQNGPYGILFHGLKAESIALVPDAVIGRSTERARGVVIGGEVYIAFGGVSQAGGVVYGIDLQGQNSLLEQATFEVRATNVVNPTTGVTEAYAPTVGWLVAAPHSTSEAGGTIRNIQLTGGSTLVNYLVHLYAKSDAGGDLDFKSKLVIDGLRGQLGTIPQFGGPGWDAVHGVDIIGADIRHLRGAPANTIGAAATFRKGHASSGRPMPLNSASAINATIPVNLARVGDVIETVQEGAGAVTMVAASGVTLDVPTGLSATTAGPGRSVRARCLGANAYRVIG